MKLEQYIKSHAKALVKTLAEDWSEKVASELQETLNDYFKQKEACHDLKKDSHQQSRGLRDCKSNDCYRDIFERALEAANHGENTIVVKPDDYGMDMPGLLSLIRNLNNSNYRKLHHPDCKTSYRTLSDGIEILFGRRDVEENE